MFRPFSYAIVLITLATCSFGCGRQVSTLTGRVTYLDKPVTSGSVVLYCEGQHIVRGLISPDGIYTIPNVPRGKALVTITPAIRLPDGFRKKYKTPPVINGPITPDPDTHAKALKSSAIPGRYGVPEESGLAVTVDQMVTEFDIHLIR